MYRLFAFLFVYFYRKFHKQIEKRNVKFDNALWERAIELDSKYNVCDTKGKLKWKQ